MPRSRASAQRGESWASAQAGVVYVEFLLAFLPVFLFVLGIAQLALVGAARVVVQHAAGAAARAAVVVLEDDPKHYGGEPRGSITPRARDGSPSAMDAPAPGGPGSESAAGASPASGLGGSGGGAAALLQALGPALRGDGSRAASIRSAAYLPLAMLAPAASTLLGTLLGRPVDLAASLEPSPLGRALFGLSWYGRAATAVTFPAAPHASTLRRQSYGRGEVVTVRVTYLLHCAVPLVARLACERAPRARGDGELGAEATAAASRQAGAEGEVDEAEAARHELGEVESPKGLAVLRASLARFLVLRAEASLPLQSASYETRQGTASGASANVHGSAASSVGASTAPAASPMGRGAEAARGGLGT